MSETVIPAQTVSVWPHLVDVVRDLAWRYTFYYDVSGSSYKVLGFGTTPDSLIVAAAPTSGIDGKRGIEMLTHNFEGSQKFCIYGVEPAAAVTSELAPIEVG